MASGLWHLGKYDAGAVGGEDGLLHRLLVGDLSVVGGLVQKALQKQLRQLIVDRRICREKLERFREQKNIFVRARNDLAFIV
jgi:hypothetical protein